MDEQDNRLGPRILLFAEYDASGGTRTYFKQLLALYAEKRAQVTILRTHRDEEIDDLCSMHGFECFELSDVVHSQNVYNGRLPWRLIHERYLFREFVKQVAADIVVASVGTPELFIGAISLSKNPLYILHTYPSDASTRFKQLVKHITYSNVLPRHIRLLTVSEFSKRRIIDAWGLGSRAGDISVVYSTVGDSIAIRITHNERPLIVLTVGHVEDYKNPDTWLRMAIDLKQNNPDLNVKFVWVGDGAKLEVYRRKVVELGSESYITFVGHDNDVSKYYQQCDVYVQPSRIESLGLSVLDAMRRGIPCVVAKTGGLIELITNGENGWTVEADDFLGLSNRIESLLRDEQCREIFGKRSLERYEAYFSHKRWAEAMWSHHASLFAA
jgi:glycosyltransferase involved in cell wall biosynthesis